MKLGIDIDGVLARFESAFAPILTEFSGIDFPLDSPDFPPVWDWPQHYGATNKEVSAAWDRVKTGPWFWASLDELPQASQCLRWLNFLTTLALEGHDVYFITHRMGMNAKKATESWLARRGIENPSVLLVRDKHLAAAALQLDVYIDDRLENVLDVNTFMKDADLPCRVYMVETPYNKQYRSTVEAEGILVVPNLWTMLQKEFCEPRAV